MKFDKKVNTLIIYVFKIISIISKNPSIFGIILIEMVLCMVKREKNANLKNFQ